MAPGARLIGDLVRDDAGQRAEIVLSSRYLDQPSDVAGAIHEALVSGIESPDAAAPRMRPVRAALSQLYQALVTFPWVTLLPAGGGLDRGR